MINWADTLYDYKDPKSSDDDDDIEDDSPELEIKGKSKAKNEDL